MPDIAVGSSDLQIHISVPKLSSGLVNIWGLAVLVGNIPKMFKLVPVLVGDVHYGLVCLVPEEPSVPVHSVGGGAGVKLDIECVPVVLIRGKNFHNMREFRDIILHLKLEIIKNEEFHGVLDVSSAVDTADIVNIIFEDRLEANCALC